MGWHMASVEAIDHDGARYCLCCGPDEGHRTLMQDIRPGDHCDTCRDCLGHDLADEDMCGLSVCDVLGHTWQAGMMRVSAEEFTRIVSERARFGERVECMRCDAVAGGEG